MADLLLEYTDLLHRYEDPDVQEVRAFVERHADDEVFLQRVRKLNALFLLKASLAPAGQPAF